jgi:hypothetical protein
MSYFKTPLLTLLLICFTSSSIAKQASTKPWYSIKKVEELQIFINFPKYIMTLNQLYFFHLRFMVHHLKINPGLHLYIYKKENRVSEARANTIENYIINVLGAPEDRVHILVENTRNEYNENTSERLRVLLTKALYFKDREPLGPEVVEVEKSVQASPPKKDSGKSIEFGGLIQASQFLEDYDAFGLGLYGKMTFNTKKTLQFHLEGVVTSIDELDGEPEMRFGLGLDFVYERVESSAQVYYKTNYVESIGGGVFDSYQDIGFSQWLRLKLIKTKGFTYKLGGFADFSFANNLEDLQNSNVYTYGFETGVHLNSGYSYKIQYRKRKLRELVSFPDSNEHISFIMTYTWR